MKKKSKTPTVLNLAYQNCDILGLAFKVYVSPNRSGVVQKILDGQDDTVIQHFKTRVRYLANTPKRDWHEPHAKKLKGVKDIYEIKFKANGVQYRPLGFFGPENNEFTILVWATHKQDIYEPSEAINTAESRSTSVNEGKASCMPLKIDGEEFPPTQES